MLQKYIPSSHCYRSRKRIYLTDNDGADEAIDKRGRSNSYNLCCCFPTARAKYLDFKSSPASAVKKSKGRIQLFAGSSYYSRKPGLTTSTTILDEYLDPQSPVSIEVLLAEQEEELDSYYSSPAEDAADYLYYTHTSHKRDSTERNNVGGIHDKALVVGSATYKTAFSKMPEAILNVDQAHEEDAQSLSEHRISAILKQNCTDSNAVSDNQTESATEQKLIDVETTDKFATDQELVDISVASYPLDSMLPIGSEVSHVSATVEVGKPVDVELNNTCLETERQEEDEDSFGNSDISVTISPVSMTVLGLDGTEPPSKNDAADSSVNNNADEMMKDDPIDNANDSAVVMMEPLPPSSNNHEDQNKQNNQKSCQNAYLPRSSSLSTASITAFPATSLPRTHVRPAGDSSNALKIASQRVCTEELISGPTEAVEATAATVSKSKIDVQPQPSVSFSRANNNQTSITAAQQSSKNNRGTDERRPSLIATAQHFLMNDKKFMDEFTEKLSLIKKNIINMNDHSGQDNSRPAESNTTLTHSTTLQETPIDSPNNQYHQKGYSHHRIQEQMERLADDSQLVEQDNDRTNIDEELLELSKKVVQNVRTLGEGLKTNGFRIFNNISTKLKTLQEEYITVDDNYNDNSISI